MAESGAENVGAGARVTIVRYGTRSTTRSDVYLNYPVYREDDGPIDMDYFFWVVQTPTETLLVDTGFSVHGGTSRGRDILIDPARALELAGVAPGTTPRIVLTHGHYDHIGNVSMFPGSTLYLSRKEYDFWTGPHADKALFHHSIEDDEIAGLRDAEAQGRIEFFEDELEIAAGVRVVEVGGHTPGQSVVFVETSEGTVLLASDAVHYYEEYERDMVFTSVADLVEMYDSFSWIRDLQSSGQVAHVVSGHDPSTLSRFTPADGPLAGFAATIGSGPEGRAS